MDSVRLRGEGGVEWEFELPLHETIADQVKARKLEPVDPDGDAFAATLRGSGTADEPAGGTGEDDLLALDRATLNKKAEGLGIEAPGKLKNKAAVAAAILAAAEEPESETLGASDDGGGDDENPDTDDPGDGEAEDD